MTPTSSKPVRRWNFRNADWDKFKLLSNKAARTLPPLEDTDLATYLWGILQHADRLMQPSSQFPVATRRTTSHAGTKNTNSCMNTPQPQHPERGLKTQLTSWSSVWMRIVKNVGQRQFNPLTSHIPAKKLGTLSTALQVWAENAKVLSDIFWHFTCYSFPFSIFSVDGHLKLIKGSTLFSLMKTWFYCTYFTIFK